MTVRWKPDHDDAQSVDDFTADDVKLVRFERMDRGAYWFCVYLVDGSEHHFDFYIEKGKRTLRCFARQPVKEAP